MKIDYNTFAGMFTKGKSETFLSSKFIFRKISIPISYVFTKIGFSSNFVTLISLIFAISGAYFQVYSEPRLIIASLILLNIYTILDHCDGELARFEMKILKKNKGPEGPYLDALVHYFFTPVFYFAIGYAKYQETGQLLGLWEGIIIGIWLSSFSQSASLRVIMDRLIENRNRASDYESIWLHDKVIDRATFTYKQKLKSIIREALSTQGQIIIISLFSIADIYTGIKYGTRFIFLDMMFILSLIGIPKASILFFKKLSQTK